MFESTNEHWLSRTELLLGSEALAVLQASHVLVLGLGGVGGAALEFLVRAGVGAFTLVDGDRVQPSNRNRQILALAQNHGALKAHEAKARAEAINPQVRVQVIDWFVDEDQFEHLLASATYHYAVDAIDTMSPKIAFIKNALRHGVPFVSSMGAGGKLDPGQVRVADIDQTHDDRLAKMLRKRLHREGVRTGFKAVFSPEAVRPEAVVLTRGDRNKKSNVGTISYMPALFGLYCAHVVLTDLLAAAQDKG